MKKVGDLFAELGFRPDASEGVKRAFVENLVRAAGGTVRPQETKTATKPATHEPSPQLKKSKSGPEQLSFSFETPVETSTKTTDVASKSHRRSG